jgi:hypothetical protein
MFKLLGVAVGLYVGYGLLSREIYARSGPGGRLFRRDEDPRGYWSAIVAYSLLTLALVFVF